MYDKINRRPLIDPLLLALKSRRVLIALMTLVLALLVMWFPPLAPFSAELLVTLTALALALIAGYSLEDAVRAARKVDPPPDAPDLAELVRGILNALLDELAAPDDDIGAA